jgi:cytidyltransferase-like protein
MSEEKPIACVSGGFDPLHVGHIRLLTGASHFGSLIVILNSDEWIFKRKGYVLMPWTERKEIIMGIKGIKQVVSVDDSDGTVCKALKQIKPFVFVNGGLRTQDNTPEKELCTQMGIKMVWGIGGASKDDYTMEVRQRILDISNKTKND